MDLDRHAATPASDVYLEVTDPDGEIAAWFDDTWWMQALHCWGRRPLAVHVLPSPGALLHPVVLHHVAMAERVAPSWRLVGYGYGDELGEEQAIEALATSAYDQVHLVEGARDGCGDHRRPHSPRIEDIIARVRRVQQQLSATRPILVRATSLPALPDPGTASSSPTSDSVTAGASDGEEQVTTQATG